MSTQYKKALAGVDGLSETLKTLKVLWLHFLLRKCNTAAFSPQDGSCLAIQYAQ